MSFRQIFDRMGRIVRSYSYDDTGRRGDDLRRAEELIEEERRREERERAASQQKAAGTGEEADQRRAAYLQAIAILSVADGASWEEIAVAYRRLVQLSHPDRTARLGKEEQDKAVRRTQELNMAYAYLRELHGKK